jgi:hypothetical protein
MKHSPFPPIFAGKVLRLGFFVALGMLPCLGAATVKQQIDPPEVNVGDDVTVMIQVQNGAVTSIRLPSVDGLQLIGTNTMTNFVLENGAFSSMTRYIFGLRAVRPGDFTIPAFDLHTQDGQILHVQAMKLHVLGTSAAPDSSITPAPPPAAIPSPNGPVIMPPPTPGVPDNAGNSADTTADNIHVPLDPDGRPAKVFMSVTPTTTDAYVGEAVPTRIEFYIRVDVLAAQDSLPTIKGSDFLMNNLSVRPNVDEAMVSGEAYRRETWVTAISAPKSGDFPFQMERDTYWMKPLPDNNNGDPFAMFFRRPSLAHGNVGSNPLTFHIHSLPEEGRPANFGGAIGHFKVTGTAAPSAVTVGEPATLHFTISGEGNFDYVKCPSLTPDPDWKAYVPSSKIEYQEETHTQGIKTFEQAVIPQKNGSLPLPSASFSYFDPTTKQYVTVPVSLPTITVSGSAPALASAAPVGSDASAAVPVATPSSELVPNRVEIGSLHRSLTPLYRQPWFWVAQTALLLFLLAGLSFAFFRSRFAPDQMRAERVLRENSLQRQEDAMSNAVQRNDPQAFFLAARNAVQLRLGGQWRMKPEAITFAEVRERDPQLAEALEPLFRQTDEVVYSGGQTDSGLNLAQWELHVRKDLLQSQSARSS